jgi:hypothetical protein
MCHFGQAHQPGSRKGNSTKFLDHPFRPREAILDAVSDKSLGIGPEEVKMHHKKTPDLAISAIVDMNSRFPL